MGSQEKYELIPILFVRQGLHSIHCPDFLPLSEMFSDFLKPTIPIAICPDQVRAGGGCVSVIV
jgi:hypothetical protein